LVQQGLYDGSASSAPHESLFVGRRSRISNKLMKNIRDSVQQKQERISRKQFEEFLETNEWITGSVDPDLGEDILVRIYDKGISTGISFYTQLKSTDNIQKYVLKSGSISYPIKVKDLIHWDAQALPVLLVIWDICQRKGWWIEITNAIAGLTARNDSWRSKDPKKTVKIHIPLDHELNDINLQNLRQTFADHFYPIISKGKDLEFRVKFSFPPTQEGEEGFAQLQNHFKAGNKIKIDGKYITEFVPSEWWNRLFGEIKVEQLVLGTSTGSKIRPMQIEFWSPRYGSEKLVYVELKLEKQGTEEITLSNKHQDHPFQIQVTINKITNSLNLKFNSTVCGKNACTAKQSLQIERIYETGGEVRITALDSGHTITIKHPPIPEGKFNRNKNKRLNFIEKVCIIQNAFAEEIIFPEDCGIKSEDIAAVDELLSILDSGIHKRTGMKFNAEFLKPAIEIMYDVLQKNSRLQITMQVDSSYVDIFSTRIELGPMTRFINGIWEIPLDEVKKWLDIAESNDTLQVQLVDVEVVEEFEKWRKTIPSKVILDSL
jgi:hypothetical protein